MLSAGANSIIRDKSKFNSLTNDICLLYIFTLFQLSPTPTMVLYDLLGIVEKCFPEPDGKAVQTRRAPVHGRHIDGEQERAVMRPALCDCVSIP